MFCQKIAFPQCFFVFEEPHFLTAEKNLSKVIDFLASSDMKRPAPPNETPDGPSVGIQVSRQCVRLKVLSRQEELLGPQARKRVQKPSFFRFLLK